MPAAVFLGLETPPVGLSLSRPPVPPPCVDTFSFSASLAGTTYLSCLAGSTGGAGNNAGSESAEGTLVESGRGCCCCCCCRDAPGWGMDAGGGARGGAPSTPPPSGSDPWLSESPPKRCLSCCLRTSSGAIVENFSPFLRRSLAASRRIFTALTSGRALGWTRGRRFSASGLRVTNVAYVSEGNGEDGGGMTTRIQICGVPSDSCEGSTTGRRIAHLLHSIRTARRSGAGRLHRSRYHDRSSGDRSAIAPLTSERLAHLLRDCTSQFPMTLSFSYRRLGSWERRRGRLRG